MAPTSEDNTKATLTVDLIGTPCRLALVYTINKEVAVKMVHTDDNTSLNIPLKTLLAYASGILGKDGLVCSTIPVGTPDAFQKNAEKDVVQCLTRLRSLGMDCAASAGFEIKKVVFSCPDEFFPDRFFSGSLKPVYVCKYQELMSSVWGEGVVVENFAKCTALANHLLSIDKGTLSCDQAGGFSVNIYS